MADQRITQLTQLAEADVAASDVLPIVDISASETKKVRAKDLFEAGAALADSSSINLDKLNQSSATKLGTTALADSAVTYAKIQNVSASDKLLGRSSAGAGVIEEITLTAAGRALLDDTDAATQRATLGLGTLATQSGTFSGTSSGTNTGDQTIALTGDVTGSGTGTFATSIANSAVTTAKINNASVTAAKMAADSALVVSGNAPSGVGAFQGQQWLNTNSGLTYVWTGATWQQTTAIQTLSFNDSTPLSFSVSKPDNFSAVVTTTLENQNAGTIFAGPATGSATTPTFRSLTSTDLPVATSGATGAVKPGTGLSVTGAGVINHTNTTTAGTYTKVTVDAQGHINVGTTLSAADIPSLDASKITSGTFGSQFLAPNSVTASQLADYGIAQVSESAPTPEFAGQWWINPSDRSAYIWIGTVSPTPNGYWLLVGYGSPTQLNVRFGGTYNANTNTVVSLNQYGTEAGLTVGQALGVPSNLNNGVYLVVTTVGTGTTPAPATSLSVGDWVLSQGTGSNWTKVAVVSGAVGTVNDYDVLCNGTYFSPNMPGVANVRAALNLLWGRVQIASTTTRGLVLESTEVLVDNSTGEMTIGTVDDGTY